MNFLRNLIQGSQSASKVDPGQKKKGPAAAPGLAGPPGNLEQKAEGQREAPVITQENTSSNSPPSSPGSPLSEASSRSLNRECDTTSATDDPSFASCLTEEPSSLSELSTASPIKDLARRVATVRSPNCEAHRQTNSVSGSVAQNNTQNGVKKDSEYESAEEVDQPPDQNFEGRPLSADPFSPSPPAGESKSAERGAAPEASSTSVRGDGNEAKTLVTADGPASSAESFPVDGEELAGKPEYLPRTISDSVITVTKSEILEESVGREAVFVLRATEPRPGSEGVEPDGTSAGGGDFGIGDPDGEFPRDKTLTRDGCESLPIKSEVQESTTVSQPESEGAKLKDTRIQFESHLDNETLSQADGGEGQCELLTTSQSASGAKRSEGPVDSADIESGLPKREDSQKGTRDNHAEEELKSDPPSRGLVDPGDAPLPPQKGYDLDFLDGLDDPSFNPFATKTVIRSSPPPSPVPGSELPRLKPAVRKKKVAKEGGKASCETSKSEVEDAGRDLVGHGRQQDDPQEISESVRGGGSLEPEGGPLASEARPEAVEKSERSPDSLEIAFEDSAIPLSRPPRRLGRKPQQQRQPIKRAQTRSKAIERNNNRVEEVPPESEELPIPQSKGYNLDFLDKLQDPGFNPFATKCSVRNSPPKEGFALKERPVLPDDKESEPEVDVVPAEGDPTREGSEAEERETGETSTGDGEESAAVPGSGTDASRLGGQPSGNAEGGTPPPGEGRDLDPSGGPDSVPGYEVHGERTPGDDRVGGDPPTRGEDLQKRSKSINQTQESKREESGQEDTQIDKKREEVIQEQPHRISPVEVLGQEERSSEEALHAVDGQSRSAEGGPEPVGGDPRTSEEASRGSGCPTPEPPSGVDAVNRGSAGRSEERVRDAEGDASLPKVPSIGTIGQLDSLEFAQLLGDEAGRLAEEFMNCSSDSGLPDSDDGGRVRPASLDPAMADAGCAESPQCGTRPEEGAGPFQRHSRLSRSPPLGKRGAVCGAESGDTPARDPYGARSQRREGAMGEERSDTVSLDDDSGIVLGTQVETEVNHSEAGPEIATGLTSSDLRCASQLRVEEQEEEFSDHITDEEFLASEAFFKQASDMENQLRRNLASPLMGSHSKLSGDEVTPTKEKKEPQAAKEPSVTTPESPQSKPVPSTSSPAPPREERSAPEGTSSPTPRPSDTSERKPSSSRPSSVPPEGYMTAAEVQELIKRQELKFEEKLLQAELAAGEKEKKLRQAMKDEQKERNHLGENLAELTQSRDALLKMVGQYKDMLASLVSEKEKDKQSAEERIKAVELERNQALEDLANVEVAFSDVHRKYERTKQVVDTLRRNEETLRGAVADYESKLQKQEQKFVEFQKHAEEKIQLANEEFEAMRKSNDQEMTKMAALLKKAEMKIMSLQDSFDRKTRENQELTQLCDDLINKVGTSH